MKTVGDGPAVKFYDLTLRNVTVAGYAEDGGYDTAVAFDYRSGTETIFAPNREGTDVGQSFSFNLARNGGTIAPVSQDTLAAFAHSHADFPGVTGITSSLTSSTATGTDAAAAQQLALLGQYAASSFAVAGDSHGASMITEPSLSQQLPLAPPHA